MTVNKLKSEFYLLGNISVLKSQVYYYHIYYYYILLYYILYFIILNKIRNKYKLTELCSLYELCKGKGKIVPMQAKKAHCRMKVYFHSF